MPTPVLLVALVCATIVPPIQRSIPQLGGGETAVYATVDGETQRVVSLYPERAARMNLQGDVVLRCSAPGSCALVLDGTGAAPENTDFFAPSAMTLAEQVLTPTRRFPVDIVVSYRIISDPADTDTLWAPSACPDRRFPPDLNKRLLRDRAINGVCVATRP